MGDTIITRRGHILAVLTPTILQASWHSAVSSTKPRDWLGRTLQNDLHLCRVGRI